MTKPTTLRSELGLLIKASDADGLRALLREGPEPSVLLGLPPENLEVLIGLPDSVLVVTIRRRLEQLSKRDRAKDQKKARSQADAAVRELVERAQWREDQVELDVGLLLGRVLGDRSTQHIVFHFEEQEHAIRYELLLKTRAALKRRHDVVVFIDKHGLHLRWNNNRGGLNLVPQPLSLEERRCVINVVLEKPLAQSIEAEPNHIEPLPIVSIRPSMHRPSISGWLARVVEGVTQL